MAVVASIGHNARVLFVLLHSSFYHHVESKGRHWSEGGGQGRVRGVQCVLTDVSKKVKTRFDELTFVAKCGTRNLLMVPPHTSVRDQSNLMSDVIVFLSNFERSTLPLPSVSLSVGVALAGWQRERKK